MKFDFKEDLFGGCGRDDCMTSVPGDAGAQLSSDLWIYPLGMSLFLLTRNYHSVSILSNFQFFTKFLQISVLFMEAPSSTVMYKPLLNGITQTTARFRHSINYYNNSLIVSSKFLFFLPRFSLSVSLLLHMFHLLFLFLH